MKTKMKILGERLRALRESRGLTQEDVAKLVNYKAATVGHWETGKRDPDLLTVQKLADFYSVSLDFLAGRTNDPRGLMKLIDEAVQTDPELARFWQAFVDSGEELRVAFRYITDLSQEDLRTIVRWAKAMVEESKRGSSKDDSGSGGWTMSEA